MSVLYHDIVPKLPLGNARPADGLFELLALSDVVTLHVPDTEATRGMIGAAELAALRSSAYLINASRGLVVDIPALRGALRAATSRAPRSTSSRSSPPASATPSSASCAASTR